MAAQKKLEAGSKYASFDKDGDGIITDEEFEMEMGRSKKDSLRKEMMIHVSELLDGNIDMNDFMNVVEDIMSELK